MTDQWTRDRIELMDVMLNYAAGVDELDYPQYQACFVDDVEILDFTPEPYRGIGPWVEYVKQALSRYKATQHFMGPMLATIDGDTAHGRTYVQASHYLKEPGPDGTTLTLWAVYETDFVRVGGQWKIKKHRLVTKNLRMH